MVGGTQAPPILRAAPTMVVPLGTSVRTPSIVIVIVSCATIIMLNDGEKSDQNQRANETNQHAPRYKTRGVCFTRVLREMYVYCTLEEGVCFGLSSIFTPECAAGFTPGFALSTLALLNSLFTKPEISSSGPK